MTYTCPHCGKVMEVEDKWKHICAGSNQYRKKCPHCNGTGRVSVGFLSSGKCPECGGTGEITKHY